MAPTSTTLHRRIYASPLGELTLTASEQGLRSLTWPEEAGGRAPADGPPIGDEPPDVAAVFVVGSYYAAEHVKVRRPLKRGGQPAVRAVAPPALEPAAAPPGS